MHSTYLPDYNKVLLTLEYLNTSLLLFQRAGDEIERLSKEHDEKVQKHKLKLSWENSPSTFSVADFRVVKPGLTKHILLFSNRKLQLFT